MAKTNIKIVFANEAKADLKFIYERILKKTKSTVNATNVITGILQASKKIHFVEQYQIDEFLGDPHRRIVVRHFKIIYKPVGNKEIRILQVFDTYQSPIKIVKSVTKDNLSKVLEKVAEPSTPKVNSDNSDERTKAVKVKDKVSVKQKRKKT